MLHLYAVLAAPPDRDRGPGLEGAPVQLFEVEGLWVAAGEVAAEVPGAVAGTPERPAPAPPAGAAAGAAAIPDVEALRLHDATVRRLALGADAILPMRFGQRVGDLAALHACVGRARARLERSLETVRGCEQLTLRAFGERASEQPPSDATPEPGLRGDAGPGTRYLLGRAQVQLAARSAPRELAPLLARLAPLVQDQRIERPAGGRLLASIYQLVRSADRPAYLARYEAGRAEPGLPHLTLSGPWPPYAFAGGLTT